MQVKEAPPQKGKGLASNTDKALISRHRQDWLTDEEVSASTNTVKADDATDGVIIPRGRLKEARHWFAHRGWDVLPQGRRGRRILKWGADHAWMASPDNPKRSVRRWCRKWAPWLKPAALDNLVVATERSNKRWNPDQCAAVLEITVRVRSTLGLRFIGADDDPNYEIRLGIRKAKAAARARHFRAAHSTGRPRGRPALALSPEEKRTRRLAQEAERKRRTRASAKNASRDIKSIGSVTELMRTRSAAIIPASAIDGIDFVGRGIIAITVMRGTAVVQAWRRAASLGLRGAQQHQVMP
jgi:hypothetical protein